MKNNLLCMIIMSFIFFLQSNVFSQGSHTPIEVKDMSAMKALVIKADIPMSELGTKMGEVYGKVFTYIGEKGLSPVGGAFAVYYSWEPNGNVVFEAGVPVSEKVEGSGDIEYKEFPQVKAVSTLYTGSYEGFHPVYADLQTYIAENKLETTGVSWEIYLTDPSTMQDPNQNQTLIYFPLK